MKQFSVSVIFAIFMVAATGLKAQKIQCYTAESVKCSYRVRTGNEIPVVTTTARKSFYDLELGNITVTVKSDIPLSIMVEVISEAGAVTSRNFYPKSIDHEFKFLVLDGSSYRFCPFTDNETISKSTTSNTFFVVD